MPDAQCRGLGAVLDAHRYGCSFPAVCTATATFDIVVDLNTVDPARVQDFELDPCGENHNLFYNGATVGKGNCSAPNTCTCLCTERSWLDEDNQYVVSPLSRKRCVGEYLTASVP